MRPTTNLLHALLVLRSNISSGMDYIYAHPFHGLRLKCKAVIGTTSSYMRIRSETAEIGLMQTERVSLRESLKSSLSCNKKRKFHGSASLGDKLRVPDLSIAIDLVDLNRNIARCLSAGLDTEPKLNLRLRISE